MEGMSEYLAPVGMEKHESYAIKFTMVGFIMMLYFFM